MKAFIAYLKDEEGQTSTEYILLLALVVMIVFRFRSALDGKLKSITDNVFGKMDDFINTTGAN